MRSILESVPATWDFCGLVSLKPQMSPHSSSYSESTLLQHPFIYGFAVKLLLVNLSVLVTTIDRIGRFPCGGSFPSSPRESAGIYAGSRGRAFTALK